MDSSKGKKKSVVPLVKLDPAQTTTLMSKALQVPQPGYQIGELVQQRRQELVEEEYDKTDAFIFEERKQAPAAAEVIDISDDEPMPPPPPSKGKGKGSLFIVTVSSALKARAVAPQQAAAAARLRRAHRRTSGSSMRTTCGARSSSSCRRRSSRLRRRLWPCNGRSRRC
jgi:hypothetical protein